MALTDAVELIVKMLVKNPEEVIIQSSQFDAEEDENGTAGY